jgi:DNA gyrase subunit A
MTTPNPNRVPVNIEDEMRRSYMDYAMSVIIGRALPDVATASSRRTAACSTA